MGTIEINFYTKNLDKRKYTDAILEFIYSHVNRDDLEKAVEFNRWIIEILPTEKSDFDYSGVQGEGSLNTGIPHGVTNPDIRLVTCFVNDFKGDLVLQQNFKTSIGHELAHMILAVYFRGRRIRAKYSDRSYTRAGMDGNYYTVMVHDRETEYSLFKNWKRVFKIWKWNIFGYHIGSIPIYCLELRDLTDSREIDREV